MVPILMLEVVLAIPLNVGLAVVRGSSRTDRGDGLTIRWPVDVVSGLCRRR